MASFARQAHRATRGIHSVSPIYDSLMMQSALPCCRAQRAAVLPVALQRAAAHREPVRQHHRRQPQCRGCAGVGAEPPGCCHLAGLHLPVRAHALRPRGQLPPFLLPVWGGKGETRLTCGCSNLLRLMSGLEQAAAALSGSPVGPPMEPGLAPPCSVKGWLYHICQVLVCIPHECL